MSAERQISARRQALRCKKRANTFLVLYARSAKHTPSLTRALRTLRAMPPAVTTARYSELTTAAAMPWRRYRRRVGRRLPAAAPAGPGARSPGIKWQRNVRGSPIGAFARCRTCILQPRSPIPCSLNPVLPVLH